MENSEVVEALSPVPQEASGRSAARPSETNAEGARLCVTNLLTDIPETTDRFEGQPHQKVARAIAELIQSPASEGITIGLEGSWGAGKTTVIHLLKNQLKANTNIELIQFDAWAHEGDPLRWTFMETLVQKLPNEWVDKKAWAQTLEELARRREVTTVKDTPVLKKWSKIFAFSLLLVPVGSALVGAAVRERITLYYTGDIAWQLIIGLLCSFAPLLLFLLQRLLPRKDDDEEGIWELIVNKGILEKRSETNKTANPTSIEFESKFKLLMEKALDNPQHRLVLIIDNLDRVDSKDALSIWATLQTFLQYRSDTTVTWPSRLWLLVLYDLKGLSLLWEKSVGDEAGERSAIGGAALSFMDKNFQIRFEVPPPVLSDWRSFLMGKLKEAFPEHDETDFHAAYRVLAIRLGEINRMPTIRELKLYVNQIGAIHRQWAAGGAREKDAFPLSHIAYYVLLRRENVDVIKKLLDADFPPQSYRELLGNDIQDSLVAIAFNVEVGIARQLLITNKVKDALSSGSPAALREIAGLPRGFWELLERIVTEEWQGAEAVKIAEAAYALHESRLLEQATRPEFRTITKAMCRIGENVSAWIELNEQRAKGIAVLIGWKPRTDETAEEYRKYIKSTFEAISWGLPTNPTVPFNVKEWLRWIELILHDLLPGPKRDAYAALIDSLSLRMRAHNNPDNVEVEMLLEALAELRSHLDASPLADEALKDLAEKGDLLEALGEDKKRDASSVAWCLYVLLRYNRELAEPPPSPNGSDQRHAYLAKQLDQAEQPVMEKFTAILAHYKELGLLFELAGQESSLRSSFARESLKTALPRDEAVLLFHHDDSLKRLKYIKEVVLKSDTSATLYHDLVQKLVDDAEFLKGIGRTSLTLELAELYLDIAESGAVWDYEFLKWLARELNNVDRAAWLDQLKSAGPLLQLTRALKQADAEVVLGDQFYHALLEFSSSPTTANYPTNFFIWPFAPFDFLPEDKRKELASHLYAKAIADGGKLSPSYLDSFGDEIANSEALKERLPTTETLFIELLLQRNLRGLQWVADVLTRPHIADLVSDPRSLVAFRQEIKASWVNTHGNPFTRYEEYIAVSDIAKILKVELPQKGKILFSSARTGSWGIYTMNNNGSDQRLLTLDVNKAGVSDQPAWSPDGKKIALRSTLHGSPDIFVMDANGKNLVRVTSNPLGSDHPAWSPDGQLIAFERLGKIYSTKTDGTSTLQLSTDNNRHDIYPAWSPDGKKIAFQSRKDDEPSQVCLMDALTGSNRKELPNDSSSDMEPAWSPDGKQIVFSSYPVSDKEQRGIFIMDANGDNRRLLYRHAKSGHPVWSPDGTKIAFTIGEADQSDIYVINADGTNLLRLTDEAGGNKDPCWPSALWEAADGAAQ